MNFTTLLMLTAHAAPWTIPADTMPHASPTGDAVALVQSDGSAAIVDTRAGTPRHRLLPPEGGRWQSLQTGADGVLLSGVDAQQGPLWALAAWDTPGLRWTRIGTAGTGLGIGAEGGLWEEQGGGRQQRLLRPADGAPLTPWLHGVAIDEWGETPEDPHSTYFEAPLHFVAQIAGHAVVLHTPPRAAPRLEVWAPTPAEAPLWAQPVDLYPAVRPLGPGWLRAGGLLLILDPQTAGLRQAVPLTADDDCTQRYVGVRLLPDGTRALIDGCAQVEVRARAGAVVWTAPLADGAAAVVRTEGVGTAIREGAARVAVFSEAGVLEEVLRLPSNPNARWWMGHGVLSSGLEGGTRLVAVRGQPSWARADVAGGEPAGGWIEGRAVPDRALVLLDPRTGETGRRWAEGLVVGATPQGAALVYDMAAQTLEAVPPPSR